MCVPNADGPVPRASKNFVPMKLLVVQDVQRLPASLLIKLHAIDAIVVSFEVYGSGVAVHPALMEGFPRLPHALPVLAGSTISKA